jgi:hypothetical protein
MVVSNDDYAININAALQVARAFSDDFTGNARRPLTEQF